MKIKLWWESRFLVLEFIAACILFLGFLFWSILINKGVAIAQIFSGNREVLYGALTTLFGTLLGFIITAVSVVLGFAVSEKLAFVRESRHYKDLWAVFKSTIRILALATGFALIGLIFDKDNQPMNFLLYCNVFWILLSVFRLGRCIWVLENIISLETKP